jgi:hypothetical protein
LLLPITILEPEKASEPYPTKEFILFAVPDPIPDIPWPVPERFEPLIPSISLCLYFLALMGCS